MYRYGHDLSPSAAVKVPGFTPPMFGHKTIANFDVYSFPQAGTYLMASVAVLLVVAFVLAWRRTGRPAGRATQKADLELTAT
jgi:hypothetical protein